jgi:hypothetical protein
MMQIVWSALILICVGLACAHIVSVMRSHRSQGESVIQSTFTVNTEVAANGKG